MVAPLAKSCNDSGGHFPRNPQGRACFCAMLCFSTLIWNTKLRVSRLASHKNRRRRDR